MASQMPIAIIGMGCRFAGEASSPEKLWKLCAEAKTAWSEFPASRFNQSAFYHPNGQKLNTMNVKGGHFLAEDLALFDASFFNFTSELAAAYDPQFRLQLELTFEALESAGLSLQDVAGTNTSVFAGAFFHDYNEMHVRDPETLPRSLLVGVGSAMAANRLSHFYDLRGTSQTIDTGCSTTLVAFHQACQSISSGESDMSIISASNVILNPDNFMVMSSTFLSEAGRSYAFDSRASGYGRGEGSATVIVKRLDHALRDGDPIRAVVRGTAVNQDGKTETITTPSQTAQASLIHECYRKAGLDPAETTYFEAHGTGTPTGDPIEAGAVGSVFAQNGSRPQALKIGSVKTNIGHTETVSGLAAIIKVTMALQKRKIPPNTNFEKPNPNIPFDKYCLKIPTKLENWPAEAGIRRASVNNFGYGGANAHVILEDFETYQFHAGNALSCRPQRQITQQGESPRSRIFMLSGKDEQATVTLASNLIEHLKTTQYDSEEQFLDNLSFTIGQRRSKFAWVNAQPATTVAELIKKLEISKSTPKKTSEKPRIGFVFTGQGAQWWAMGRELIEAYPVFKNIILAADKHLKEFGSTWNLLDELTKSPKTTRVNELAFSTPLCAIVQIGLVELLHSWGVVPTALCSHSSGEVAAAYASGSLSLRSAMAIVFARGQVAGRTIPGVVEKKGGMIATGLGAEQLERDYLSHITNGQVVVACLNSPSSTTASGDTDAVEELEKMLKADNIFGRRLKIDCAYHSHHMRALSPPYFEWLDRLIKPDGQMNSAVIYASPTTGQRETDGAMISGPQHWVNSFASPVQFTKALHAMCFEDDESTSSNVDIIIEIGPHAALSGPIQETIAQPNFHGCQMKYFGSLVRKSSALDTMHALASELIRAGHALNMGSVNFPNGSSHNEVLHDLPSYPWNHQMRHWSEPRMNRRHRHRTHADHDLLGSLVSGTNMLTPTWRHVIRLSDLPWLRDHVIQTDIVFPGAGFICMAIQGMQQLAELDSQRVLGYHLRNIEVLLALVIPDNADGVEIQITLTPTSSKAIYASEWKEFHVYSVNSDDKWTEHCKGLIKVDVASIEDTDANADVPASAFSQLSGHSAIENYRKSLAPADVYDAMHKVEVRHGPIFQNLTSVKARKNQAVATFAIADTAATQPCQHQHSHVIHPTTLDVLFQFGYGNYIALPGANMAASFVPRVIKGLYVSHDLSSEAGHVFRAYSDIVGETSNSFDADIVVVNHDSHDSWNPKPLIKVEHYITRSLGDILQPTNVYEKLSTISWQPDVSLAGGASLKKALYSESDMTAVEISSGIRQLCQYFMQQALKSLSTQDVLQMEPHHRYFHYWMMFQAELAHSNKLFVEDKEGVGNSSDSLQALVDGVKNSVSGQLISTIGPNIASILKGEVDLSSVLPEGDLLAQHFAKPLGHTQSVEKIAAYVKLCAHKQPGLNILQVNGGSGALARKIVEVLGTHAEDLVGCYDVTNTSSECIEAAQQIFTERQDLVTWRELDIEKNPEAQNFEAGTYDLVIMTETSSQVRNTTKALGNVRKLLKQGGSLLFTDAKRDLLDRWFIFGLLPEWWQPNQQKALFRPSPSRSAWNDALCDAGFGSIKHMLLDSNTKEHHSSSLFISNTSDVATLSAPPTISAHAPVVLVTDVAVAGLPTSWADKVKQSIFAITGAQPSIEPLTTVDPEGKLCIFLGDLSRPFLKDPNLEEFIAIRDLCTKSKGVLWLTQGAAMDYQNIDNSLNQGFLRTLRTEYAGKRAITLDLDPKQELWSESSVGTIGRVFEASFDYTQPLLDFEYAERDGVVHVPRFYEDTERNKMFFPKSARKMVAVLEQFNQPERPLRLAIGTTGLLDTLTFMDDTDADSAIQPQQIQISPKAFGANSRDVLAAMGQLEANILGFECAGVISSVGYEAAKRGFKVGDRVAALMNGHFSSAVRTNWTNVVHIPENTSFEVAASLPYCASTAYICLIDIAKVQRGDSVLIHAATGGLGQSAIMIARHVGANIFVTASTPEKQKFLHERYNIPTDHIFNSRDKSFTAGILSMTGGQGVDIVLNSLSGTLLQESFNCVAQFGRFIEVGKKDLESDNSLQMGAFTRSVSFSSFDLLQFEKRKGERVHAVLKNIMALAEQKAVSHAEPLGVNALSDVMKTFRLLQTGKQMGKFVLSVSENEEVSVLPRVPVVKLRADSSYLVVGGLGGIGRSVCEWLIDHGARNLIVMSRSASTEKIRPFTDEVAQYGCKVYASACDIADKHSVETAFNDCDRNMPAIRGVIQGAMVLHDSLMERMTPTQWNGAIRPKVHGSWNLHERLHSKDVDFFVMLSSLSGIVGLASQCNYAAGNAYQDALAKYRSREGLHAAAIDIGVVQAVGVVAENEKLAAGLKRSGYKALTEDQVLQVLESAITSSPTDAMLIGIEGADWAASGLDRDQRFTPLKVREVSRNQQADGKAGGPGELAGLIASASTFDDAVEAVVGGITKQLVDIFMMEEAEVDPSKSLTAYGVDSLSAVELRNMLALRGGAEVSIFDIMQARSVTGLATVVAAASSHIDATLVPAK